MSMKENFWQDLPRPFFVLAPMEDVTDVVFRHVVAEAAAPDVYFTEFTNSDSYCHPDGVASVRDRKSTRLNSSHVSISYAVFCLKKNKNIQSLRHAQLLPSRSK